MAGVLSVVGRNGMGKTTLCKAIMGLVPVAIGLDQLCTAVAGGQDAADIARLGVGYVPQGGGLWRSLTVDEHLKMVATKGGAWTVERIYSTFPRLPSARAMAARSCRAASSRCWRSRVRALTNPAASGDGRADRRPCPGHRRQVEEMLLRLADEGDMEVLVIEQNIGVACAVSDNVAIMVNGRINRHCIRPRNWRRPRSAAAAAGRWAATPMTTRPRRQAQRQESEAGPMQPAPPRSRSTIRTRSCRTAGRNRSLSAA
jgi:ABC-type branched-subunit amino acid transport system ATPase component